MWLSVVNRQLIWSGFLLSVAGGAFVSAQPGRSGVLIMKPSDAKWAPVPGYPAGYTRMMLEGKAGDSLHTYRVRIPERFRAEPHTHPAEEYITVLQGTWYIGFGESFDPSALKPLPAGSFVKIPAGTPHFISTETEAIIQVHGIGPVALRFVSTKEDRR
jgi:quercetin dioxygenase-like cupin family protein